MSTIAASASHINPVNETLYRQSNLLGDWKGTTKQNHAAVEFKVISINGSTAQVEYTHNGRTERGQATVSQNSISFGNVTIATRNGTQAAFEFAYQPSGQLAATGTQTAVLTKDASATAANANPLVGSWTGATVDHTASFTVSSIDGRDAQVKYAVDGRSGQGTGDVSKNSVLLGNVAFNNIDGTHGTVTYQTYLHQTITLPVTKFVPKTA
ncbi:hypothetical protein [Bradyrhizobium erythrophlei]|uniref:Uncharacterized protein n=1 Tax=Bradyrhizobium erythrophlei TaxID=1437360 RepID=A0A1M7UD00_9BRAD|nr:hypothetical protein [Bradyrhizobium erythrophlei]SHN80873.1 hypothetical protein SAMN05444170_4532 [Bradyrhizobium erythrophlei]